jgi:AcrR family transcriptional regulator
MGRFVGGCLGRVAALAVIVVVVAFAWLNRHELNDAWGKWTGGERLASQALAAQADEKLASLSADNDVWRVALHQDELQSLIVYRWTPFLPADVADPRVTVADGRLTLEGGVATARFGRIQELRDIVAFLPDTASLRAVASFVPLDSGRVALEVHELSAAGIPIPGALIPTILSRFRGAAAPGVAPNALAVPLPPGIRGAFVSGDSLVFLANEDGGA